MGHISFLKLVIAFIAISLSANGEESIYSACSLRFGFLTYEDGYLAFSSDGKKEIYEPFLVSENSLPLMSELPGYREIGVKSASGEELLFKGPRSNFLMSLPENHPNFKIKAFILESKIDRSRLEVNVKGKTPVVRIEIDLEGDPRQDRNIFWKTISPEDLAGLQFLNKGR